MSIRKRSGNGVFKISPNYSIMPREVVLYASSATGMLTTKKYITQIQNLLQAKGVKYTEIDCAVELDKRDAMAAISGTKVLPQVFVDGKYVGVRQFCSLTNRNPHKGLQLTV